MPVLFVFLWQQQAGRGFGESRTNNVGNKSMYAGKDYDNAMLMIDSLMKTYPGLIDVQRKAMHIQTMITEKRTLADSIANEKSLSKVWLRQIYKAQS